jgi:cyclase
MKFKNPTYLGDPINAVKIFNDKKADELIFLDIGATLEKKDIQLELISDIASECFMPFSYGGGIRTIASIKDILRLGIEKVIINTYAIECPEFIKEASDLFGSQSIVVSIDVKRNELGRYEIFTRSGTKNTYLNPVDFALKMEQNGAGEIFLNSIDQDGMMQGYDIELIKMVSHRVSIPVIACGGAGEIGDFIIASEKGGVSALAAGSFFLYQGKHRAFLINFPERRTLDSILQ